MKRLIRATTALLAGTLGLAVCPALHAEDWQYGAHARIATELEYSF